MRFFEYTERSVNHQGQRLITWLNSAGMEGWELIDVPRSTKHGFTSMRQYLFKREIKPAKEVSVEAKEKHL